MCGIFGYVGKKDAVKISLEGLKKLEYRGYDSAGIAGIKSGAIHFCREVGKVTALEEQVNSQGLSLDAAIAHTRWATHGKPSIANAHPQFDHQQSIAVMHNGIIENYDVLRNQLKAKGFQFHSETDTEVIANQIAALYRGDIVAAVQETLPLLKGSFAFSIVHCNHPGKIIAAAHECPLLVGIGQEEHFLSSDPNAFLKYTKEIFSLDDGEIAVLAAHKAEVFDKKRKFVQKKKEILDMNDHDLSKGKFKHFMLKEINEQPTTLRNAMLHRILENEGTAVFDEISFTPDELRSFQNILILACGTLHA
jgi:glutamine---fructose-6-phosphate transaminase (isomerizing)